MSESKIFNVVVGTAGHIDHGKSRLVKRLTGQDPDRLKEERERGLTIDLGYAELSLGSGLTVGIIDVPGHERFVRNMVAGATGVDFVLLVVAADDGVMPQTREHLDIMSMLGLERGVVVLTKIDLVEPDFLDLVEEDLREYLAGTFLAEAPIMRVSSETGEGLSELRAYLSLVLPGLEQSRPRGSFRMPVQRSFSVKGFGTVVTGVPVSGQIRVGETVEVLPGGTEARVRGIEAYHVKTDTASVGHRAALNLSDVDYKRVGRGYVVAAPGVYSECRFLELELHHLKSNRRPLSHRSMVSFHAGTHDTLGRISLLDRKALQPGETGLAQIRLDDPVVVAPGDRFVVRLPSPSVTIGGGKVIGESTRRLKRFKSRVQDGLSKKLAALGDAARYLSSLLEESGAQPLSLKELAARSKLSVEEVKGAVAELKEAGSVLGLERDSRFVHESGLVKGAEILRERLAGLHRDQPLRLGHSTKEVFREIRLPGSVIDEVLRRAIETGEVERVATGDLVLAGHGARLSDQQRQLMEKVEAAYRDASFSTPSLKELKESLRATGRVVDELVELLMQQGVLIRLKGGLILHRSRVAEACQRTVEYLEEKNQLLATEFKDLLQTTRKYAIPLLEHLDALGVTVRDGNHRRLNPEWPGIKETRSS